MEPAPVPSVLHPLLHDDFLEMRSRNGDSVYDTTDAAHLLVKVPYELLSRGLLRVAPSVPREDRDPRREERRPGRWDNPHLSYGINARISSNSSGSQARMVVLLTFPWAPVANANATTPPPKVLRHVNRPDVPLGGAFGPATSTPPE